MWWKGIHWWPMPGAELSKDVPAEIADAFREATICFAANCYRASVTMSRRTVEAVTSDRETHKKNDLKGGLEALAEKEKLQPALQEWAQEVRLIGNRGAHYNPLEQVSEEDARDLVNFIRELLKHIYELPAQLKRRRERSE